MVQIVPLPYNIILRPHPEYVKRHSKKYKNLKEKYKKISNISFDEKASLIESITTPGLLITDRSGIALEYAFGTLRPVLFIDTLQKS